MLAWKLGWKPDTHCIEEIPLILYTCINWDTGLENKIDISLDLWIHLSKKTFPSLSHPRKAIAVCYPSLTWSYLQGRSQGPRVFPRGHESLPGTAGFLNKCSRWSLGIQAPSRYDSIARISWNIVYKCLPKSEKNCEKMRISFRIIHLMHMTQEVHIREMTLAGSWTVLTQEVLRIGEILKTATVAFKIKKKK